MVALSEPISLPPLGSDVGMMYDGVCLLQLPAYVRLNDWPDVRVGATMSKAPNTDPLCATCWSRACGVFAGIARPSRIPRSRETESAAIPAAFRLAALALSNVWRS